MSDSNETTPEQGIPAETTPPRPAASASEAASGAPWTPPGFTGQAAAEPADAARASQDDPSTQTASAYTQPTQPLAAEQSVDATHTQPTQPLAAEQPAYAAYAHPTVPLTDNAAPAAAAPEYAWAAPVATDREPRRTSAVTKVAGVLVAAALVGGAAGLGGSWVGSQYWEPTKQASSGGQNVTINDTSKVNQTTAIAAKVTPSVVTIEAQSTSAAGTGSGVVLTADGYVVTNTHVVTLDGEASNATLRVTTSDGHIYNAKVVGLDPVYDLAVIKLEDASGLTPIEFGDATKLNVGDATVAVGAPLGLSSTVTTGIVSALNRSIEVASSAAPDSSSDDSGSGEQGNGQNSPFQFDIPGQGQSQQSSSETIKLAVIQTDAAINPGNSGGALVNSQGQLVGINVAIASTGSSSSSGQSGSIGVGFAIPSDIVKRVSDEIIQNGSATHGLLGASVASASTQSNATIQGALIDSVVAGGGAQAAGLAKGDVITAFDGVPVTSSVDLTAQVRAHAAGAKATVTYVRNGQTQTTDVTLGSLKS